MFNTSTKDREHLQEDIRMADRPEEVRYVLYRCLGQCFTDNRSSKTVHDMYKHMILDPSWAIEMFKDTKWTRPDVVTALQLAWQVLFVKEIMKYELEKELENGPITFMKADTEEVKA